MARVTWRPPWPLLWATRGFPSPRVASRPPALTTRDASGGDDATWSVLSAATPPAKGPAVASVDGSRVVDQVHVASPSRSRNARQSPLLAV